MFDIKFVLDTDVVVVSGAEVAETADAAGSD